MRSSGISVSAAARDAVSLEEARQLAIGVEDVALLVRAVEAAGAQGVEQVGGLRHGEQAGAEDGDLALEHQLEPTDAECVRTGDLHEVVGVVEAVVASVGAQRVIHVAEGQLAEAHEVCGRPLRTPAREAAGIDRGPILRADPAQGVEQDATPLIGDRLACRRDVSGEHVAGAVEGRRELLGQIQAAGAVGSQEIPQERQEAPQVAERHHRDAVPDQGVVGVVPLGPLRVHPDAGLGDERRTACARTSSTSFSARVARQGWPVVSPRRRASLPSVVHPAFDGRVQRRVEDDRVVRIGEQAPRSGRMR